MQTLKINTCRYSKDPRISFERNEHEKARDVCDIYLMGTE